MIQGIGGGFVEFVTKSMFDIKKESHITLVYPQIKRNYQGKLFLKTFSTPRAKYRKSLYLNVRFF